MAAGVQAPLRHLVEEQVGSTALIPAHTWRGYRPFQQSHRIIEIIFILHLVKKTPNS
jgi:hypothetical protein